MKQYLDLLNLCNNSGVRQQNRTGIDTFMVPGGMMQFDLVQGFPILTTKKVNFEAVAAELIGFIRGYTSAADFRALGCKIWDANANENKQWLENPHRKGIDDLGRIYGAQWRDWQAYRGDRFVGFKVDQFARALETILKDPTSRRICVSAWQPGELSQMALPPCHLFYQFLVGQQEHKLHMTMYMRSCDMFLGVPFNISSYALLLSIVAAATNYYPGTLTMFLADVHIYENHLAQVKEQLLRSPKTRPVLKIMRDLPLQWGDAPLKWIESLEPRDLVLEDYDPYPAIKATMAV